MVIGIDGNEANVEKKVGIGEYAFEILKNFKELTITNKQDTNKLQNLKFQIYLKDAPRQEMPEESENWKYIIVKPRKLWTQIGLPLYLFTHFPRPDVFFSPSHYAPRFSPVKTAIAIMDVSYIHFPELFAQKDLYQLVHWTAYSAKAAAKIFTISNASKNDILKAYKKNPGDVVVTYPGIRQLTRNNQQETNMEQLTQKYGILKNYVLFVGTLQPRKNIARLIEAFSQVVRGPVDSSPHSDGFLHSVQSRHSSGDSHACQAGDLPSVRSSRATPWNLQLVIVGKKGWLYEDILAAPGTYGVEESVKFLDFVPQEDLPSLYTHALCYVLPSLYEGFGLPVLEAMKYGCPVITSNVSSLPEAGGDAALYVDPENVEDIAKKIKEVLVSEKLREEMRKKGYAHIKKFSWEKAAKETLQVLEELGKSS